MGSTSVSGVSGVGSAEGSQRGSSRMTLGVGHLIGPRIISAGTVTCAASTAKIDHEPVTSASTSILLTSSDATAAFVASRATASPTAGLSNSFTITASTTGVVSWAILQTGQGDVLAANR